MFSCRDLAAILLGQGTSIGCPGITCFTPANWWRCSCCCHQSHKSQGNRPGATQGGQRGRWRAPCRRSAGVINQGRGHHLSNQRFFQLEWPSGAPPWLRAPQYGTAAIPALAARRSESRHRPASKVFSMHGLGRISALDRTHLRAGSLRNATTPHFGNAL